MSDLGDVGNFLSGGAAGVNSAINLNMAQESLKLKRESAAINNEVGREQLEVLRNQRVNAQKEQARLNTLVHADTIKPTVPEYAWPRMYKMAQTHGLVNPDGTITVGNLEKMGKIMADDPFVNGQLAKDGISFSATKLREIDAALADPKLKDKDRQALQSQRIAVAQEYNGFINTQRQHEVELMQAFQNYTPESVQAFNEHYSNTGTSDFDLLKPVQGAAKDESPTNIKEIRALVRRGYSEEEATKMVYGDKAPGGEKQPKPKMKDLTTRLDKLQKELHRIQTGQKLSSFSYAGMTMDFADVVQDNDGDEEAAKKAYRGFLEATIKQINSQIDTLRNGGSQETKFSSEAEANRAIRSGRLKPGDSFYIGNRRAVVPSN